MSDRLRVTPPELMRIANKVAEKAGELEEKCKTLDNKIEILTTNAKGLASNAFYNRYVEMQEAVHGFPKVVQAIASTAQSAAKAYNDADENLAQTFSGK